jgi:adenine-specific DNA glycosylase
VPSDLERALDRLEAAQGPADPLPATNGWELVVRENIAYLVDDETRGRCMRDLRRKVGLAPEAILAASDDVLASVVAGMRPNDRIARLRRCAELMVADAPWSAYPGIGRPGVERIELFSGARAVLALESNGVRVLYRLGYGDRANSYERTYRQVRDAAEHQLANSVSARQRAHQLLRRHGQLTCTRASPACPACPLRDGCAAGRGELTLADPFAAK